MKEFSVSPDVADSRLTRELVGKDQHGNPVSIDVIEERPLTLYLNGQEVITLMTIGDHPRELALGFLLNQNLLKADDDVTEIEYHEDLKVVVVRTATESSFENKLKKKVKTSGCAQGTMFGDVMESFEAATLDTAARLNTSWLYTLFKKINHHPSLYLKAGAIHGCVLCEQDRPLIYMEDVGRHNAVDKIAGYMALHKIAPEDKIFFTTGRLTSEMIIKTVQMRIPILISRSGFTVWGVELARQANLTLLGRAKGKRFTVLAGDERLVYDAEPPEDGDESSRHQRKGSHE